MKHLLSINRINEYITISMLVVLVSVGGIISAVVTNDIIIVATTAALILSFLLFIGEVRPIHLLYTLCFGASFLPYINLQVFPLSGVYVVALLFVMFSLISMFINNQQIVFTTQAKWLALFLVYGTLISLAVAPDKRGVLVYSGQFFVYICIYIAAVNVLDEKPKIVRALKYILYGSIVPLAASFVQLVVSFYSIQQVINLFYESILGKLFSGARGLERIGESASVILNRGSNVGGDLVLFRVFGTFEGPTVFGSYLLLVGLIAAGLYFVQIKKKRVGFSGYATVLWLVLISVFLVMTWTRSALLAFLMAGGFIILYRYEKALYLFSAKNIKLAILLILVPMGLLFLMTDILSLRTIGGSTAGRLLTMLFALHYISQNPIVGTGMNNYQYVQPGVDVSSGEATFATAHNTYLELGVEVGLPGLLIFLFILRSFIQQAAALVRAPVRSFYHTLGMVFTAMWIGFILVSFFKGGLVHPRFMTLLLLLAGIQSASYQLYLNDKKKAHTVYRLQAAH